jgi:putative transposase
MKVKWDYPLLFKSLMKAKKTIKAKILELRKGKEELLKQEYENFQRYLHGDKSAPLYSATRQQADRLLKRIDKPKEGKEYPLILRRDVYRATTKLTQYWLKIPIHGVRGGINVPIRPHTPITKEMVCREAKIIRRKGEWFVYITVEAEIPEKKPNSVLAVDLGIHNIATTVNSTDGQPKFYGKKLRAIRGHYFHLRRNLPNRKAVRKVGNHERHIVSHELHKISKAIVQEAVENNSVIVVGKLKGIRRNHRGRTRNRKLNNFPYHKLFSFIEYKANWQGIPVLNVSEAYTSQTCSRCGEKGLRVRGLFQCPHCGLNLNADYNGARNILKRALGKLHAEPLLSVGVGLTQPELLAEAMSQ